MSELFKISGKKVKLPGAQAGWSFTPRPGGWLIAERDDGNGVIERRRFFLTESKGKLSASLGGHLYHGEIASAARGASGAVAGGDSDLVSQFPGKVRKILVASGASVQEGQPLLLIEAMKMEFAIKAPYAGTIKTVHVKEGQQLAPGTRFLDMDAAPESETASEGDESGS